MALKWPVFEPTSSTERAATSASASPTLLRVALPLAAVLSRLALGILRRRPGRRFGGELALGRSRRMPGLGAESGLLQFGGERRQIFAQVSGQPGVGSAHLDAHVR